MRYGKINSMEALARTNRETLEQTIRACLQTSTADDLCDPAARLSALPAGDSGPLAPDFPQRTQLPLPIASGPMLQSERLLPKAQLQDSVFQFWIKRSWDERCTLFPSNETICMPRAQMEALKADIHIPDENKLVLVSLIGSKDHCASVNLKTNKVNWSSCAPSSASQQWLFDSSKRTLTQVANGKCLNVEASKSGNDARLITYDCAKNINHKNDKWTLSASKHGAWMLKPEHATEECLSTRPGALSSGMELGLKGCDLDGKSSWNQINWVIISAP